MIEVIPDFEMPAVKFLVTAKEQDCTQANSFETVPPGRALQRLQLGAAIGATRQTRCGAVESDGSRRSGETHCYD
jgi:hypothetical protein